MAGWGGADHAREEDLPPKSRVFVVCGRIATEEQLRTTFAPMGTIEHVRLLKRHGTDESKGLAYIKYTRASEAARAVETLNNRPCVEGDERYPLMRVCVASPRINPSPHAHGASAESVDVNEYPPNSRLFVLSLLAGTKLDEGELRTTFGSFGGHIESVRIIKDHQTGAAKNIAFVKFSRAYHAARAMEGVLAVQQESPEPPALKVVFADKRRARVLPPPPPPQQAPPPQAQAPVPAPQAQVGGAGGFVPHPAQAPLLPHAHGHAHGHGHVPRVRPPVHISDSGAFRLYAWCGASVPEAWLVSLFQHYGGVVELKKDRFSGASRGFCFVHFSGANQAHVAMQATNNLQTPFGTALKVSVAEPRVPKRQRVET